MGEGQLSTDSFPHHDNGRLLAEMSSQPRAPQSVMRRGSLNKTDFTPQAWEGLRFPFLTIPPGRLSCWSPVAGDGWRTDIAQLCWLFCAAKSPEPTLWEGSLEEVEQKLPATHLAHGRCARHARHCFLINCNHVPPAGRTSLRQSWKGAVPKGREA